MPDIIDLKFKDATPEETVAKIQEILKSLDIEVEENWTDSGIENCWSLSVKLKGGIPASNGKGVTKALARASAYAEFIERLQPAMHYYKFRTKNSKMSIHPFTPDGKYMTVQELEENGEWIDHIIQSHGKAVTKKKILNLCKALSASTDDKILTVPFYSILEDKYVYLPVGFVNQMYTSNGCCAGNTKEEAFVHAISEIFERYCKDKLMVSGTSAPKISDEVIKNFPTVSKILDKLRENGNFDVTILDISYDTGYPVVATRIIDKKKQSYIVNAAADPVLEIAIQRTLTETFQGRNVYDFYFHHNGKILNKITDFPIDTNVRNSHVNSAGIFTADFFCDADQTASKLHLINNSDKTNRELMDFAVACCKKLNKPIYIRNYSYLGFTCYKVIIPGISEALWTQLLDPMPDQLFVDEISKTLRDAVSASKDDLALLLMCHNKIINKIDIGYHFNRLSGVPLDMKYNTVLLRITLAHAAYKLGKIADAINYCAPLLDDETVNCDLKEYLTCLQMYLKLKEQGIAAEKIRIILPKFFPKEPAQKLFNLLDQNKSPYEEELVYCDYSSCNTCKHASICTYSTEIALINKIGNEYKKFTDGQNKENFPTI